MATIRQSFDLGKQLRLAVLSSTPHKLASAFLQQEGQFYDREPFDRLARDASSAYRSYSPALSDEFERRLNRGLELHERPRVTFNP